MLIRPTQQVLCSVVACQRARRRLAIKTAEEETNLYGLILNLVKEKH